MEPKKPQPHRDLGNRVLLMDGQIGVAPVHGSTKSLADLRGATRDSFMRVGQHVRQDFAGQIMDTVDWSDRQLEWLRRHGYDGRLTEAFLTDASVQFPLELGTDTQDLIRMFVGGQLRTNMEWRVKPGETARVLKGQIPKELKGYQIVHAPMPRVPAAVVKALRPYIVDTRDAAPTLDLTLTKLHAGYFLRDFFTRHTDFARKPSGAPLGRFVVSE